MSGWVCDNITTWGRTSFTIACGIQMECHLLSNEGVEVHIMKTIPTTTEGLCRVSWGARRSRTHRYACHGTTKTWGKKKKKKLSHSKHRNLESHSYNTTACNWKWHFNWPCSAIASLKGCRSVSTEFPVSGADGRLADTMATLGGARAVRGGGTLPHKKLMRSSRLIVLLRFFTHAITSLFLRW